ncbi:MAG: hypothetical protein HYW49_03845 [Deltaproteobacteria bacterium]|nr:hypothetical protein [Deltaproteobacteria bacterium]
MATKDKSVGVGFSNTNVYVLYKKAQAAAAVSGQPITPPHAPSTSTRVLRPEDLSKVQITRFEPRNIAAAASAPEFQARELDRGVRSLDDLKANFKKLQDLHGRLRFMLEELEALVSKKK